MRNKRRLLEEWEKYRDCYDGDVTALDPQETELARHSFYAGAMVMMTLFETIGKQPGTEERKFQKYEMLKHELLAFSSEIITRDALYKARQNGGSNGR